MKKSLSQTIAGVAAVVVLLLPAMAAADEAGSVPGKDQGENVIILADSDPPDQRKPALILSPPPGESATETPPEESATEAPADPPPIARKKPERPKASAAKPTQKAPAKKAPAKKATAKKAPAKKAPARAATAPPQQAKACDYCYGCESHIAACSRKWVCGNLYSELKSAGLCRR